MPDVAPEVGDIRPELVSRDRAIAALARRQHGVVAHRQLIGMDLTPAAVQHRLRGGRLHRVHRGVYSVGHALLSGHGRWMAAVLTCGDGALLSHLSAAGLWGILRSGRVNADVTAVSGQRRPRIAVHRVRRIDRADRASVDGIPVTTVARTLLDVADLAPKRLGPALEAAERLGLFDLRAVEAALERARGHHGARALRAGLGAYRDPAFTRSGVERRFLRLCREAGLPAPAVNTWLAGHEVDMVWHDRRLAVELDTRDFHATRAAFERDRIRDADLQLAGYRALRITDARLRSEPARVVSVVRALLAAGGG